MPSYALPVDAETSRVSAVEIRRAAAAADATEPAPGLDHAMLEALEVPFRETELALAKALALLQKKHSHAGRVMTASKAKAAARTERRAWWSSAAAPEARCSLSAWTTIPRVDFTSRSWTPRTSSRT